MDESVNIAVLWFVKSCAVLEIYWHCEGAGQGSICRVE